MGDDISFDPYHVIIDLHHRPPPVAADIVAQLNAERPEVIDAGDPAIDLGVGVDEAASLTQRDDLFNGDKRSVSCRWWRFVLSLCHESPHQTDSSAILPEAYESGVSPSIPTEVCTSRETISEKRKDLIEE